jgi:hypothetical protein
MAILPENIIQIDFSDVQDQRLDGERISQMLRSHRIQPSDKLIQASKPPDALRPYYGGVHSYLVSEVQLAHAVGILLPKNTEVSVEEIKQHLPVGSEIEMSSRDGRLEIRSRLIQPRTVAVGLVLLRPHHSKVAGYKEEAKHPATTVSTAWNLGWIESLPEPTASCTSEHQNLPKTFSGAQKFLTDAVQHTNSGLQGHPYPSNSGGVVVATDPEQLKDSSSTELEGQDPWTKIRKLSTWLCAPWYCSAVARREFVLVAGNNPWNNTDSVLSISDQIKVAAGKNAQRKPDQPVNLQAEQPDMSYKALLYISDFHWDNTYHLHGFGTVMNPNTPRAVEHLQAAKLNDMLPCH